jgi:hypothetical protein
MPYENSLETNDTGNRLTSSVVAIGGPVSAPATPATLERKPKAIA